MLTQNAQVRVVLIRPGATEYDLQGRVQGNLEIPLCAQGQQEVEQMVPELSEMEIRTFYAAVGPAAQQTAQTLAQALGVKVKNLGKLDNINWGLWQGMCFDEIRHKHPKLYRHFRESPETICPPQGESIQELCRRAQGVLRRIVRRHRGQTIGIVAPEPLLSVIRHLLDHSHWGNLWQAARCHGTWQTLTVDAEGFLAK